MQDHLIPLLSSFGVNIASNIIYDLVKARLLRGPAREADIVEEIQTQFPKLTLQGVRAIAKTVIDLFARNGDIEVRGSTLQARDSVWMRSAPGTTFTFGDGSVSETQNSRIEAGSGAYIQGTGGAEIRQNPDGSISFLT